MEIPSVSGNQVAFKRPTINGPLVRGERPKTKQQAAGYRFQNGLPGGCYPGAGARPDVSKRSLSLGCGPSCSLSAHTRLLFLPPSPWQGDSGHGVALENGSLSYNIAHRLRKFGGPSATVSTGKPKTHVTPEEGRGSWKSNRSHQGAFLLVWRWHGPK